MNNIVEIKNANVQPWETFKPESSEAAICAREQITSSQLRTQFREKIKHLAYQGNGFSVEMSQHPGVRYLEKQEDKSRFLTIPFDDVLTLDEIVEIIQQTIMELSASIHARQKTGEIIHSGCTLSGFFVFVHDNKKYAMTMQMGDSVLFAVTEDGKCISLANTHGFDNEEEKTRVLKAILKSIPDNDDLVNAIQTFATSIKSEARGGLPDDINDYGQVKINQLRNDPGVRLPTSQYISYLDGRVEEFLTHEKITGAAAVECVHALFSCLNNSLFYVKNMNIDGVHECCVTRGFGDFEIQPLGGYSSNPEINIYELPEGNLLLCAATDGISELLGCDAIAECAEETNSNFDNNDGFTKELLYRAYCLDKEFCDNETVSVLRLTKESLKNTALLSYVLDGHGNSDNDASKKHAANVVNKELGSLFKFNMVKAIAARNAQNNNEGSSVNQLTFDRFRKAPAASSVSVNANQNLPVMTS